MLPLSSSLFSGRMRLCGLQKGYTYLLQQRWASLSAKSSPKNPFDELESCGANFTPLTPLNFIERTASIFPDYRSVVYNDRVFTWSETYQRAKLFASALSKFGVRKNDTVATILPNVPAMLEAHFGVPMAGAVLCTVNTRLAHKEIAYILRHSDAKVLFTDREYSKQVKQALHLMDTKPIVIDVNDEYFPSSYGQCLGNLEYEDFLKTGSRDFSWIPPLNEWDAISLNYTSGTTGNPKGVVYHHRGAALASQSNIAVFNLKQFPVYLWTVPMFHCNGWTFPWAITNAAGTHICLRKVDPAAIFRSIVDHRVDIFGGAPVVMKMLLDAEESVKLKFHHPVKMITAAAPPPPAVLKAVTEDLGIDVYHVYGLTETYGPITVCAWKKEWDHLDSEIKAQLKSRQGVRYDVLKSVMVADPVTMKPVPMDGVSRGEIFFKGNAVMKGYFKDLDSTRKAFRGGWFATGDIAVMHPDGYLSIKDRSKDIIISGGENISSIEVENIIFEHASVALVAVIGREDRKWGEVPVAFVNLKPAFEGITTADDILLHCKKHLSAFKCPKEILFHKIPTTSTGKVKKFELRKFVNPPVFYAPEK